jgi:hypothetical protein
MIQLLGALLLVSAFALRPGTEPSQQTLQRTSISAPTEKPPAPKPVPKAPAMSCTLLTTEAPRGGRLEVEGTGFGKAPLVRIAGRVTRMIERNETKIAVQIHIDSNGGAVTVKSGSLEAQCGTLTIIGKN